MTPKISSAVHSLLAGVSSLAAASVAVADPQLTNLSECPGAAEPQSCACADASHSSADNGCIKINLAMGLSTPWTGSRTAAIKVFSDDFAPSVFTPETLHAVVGYTYKRLGQKVLADGRTPKEVVFSQPPASAESPPFATRTANSTSTTTLSPPISGLKPLPTSTNNLLPPFPARRHATSQQPIAAAKPLNGKARHSSTVLGILLPETA